jgi:hypothetical protein
MIVKMKSLQGAQPFPCEWPLRLAAWSRTPRTCQRLFERSTKPLVICLLPRRYPHGHLSCGHQLIPWTAMVNPQPAASPGPWQVYQTGWEAFPQIWVSRCLYFRRQKKHRCRSRRPYSGSTTSFLYFDWMIGLLCVAFASANGAAVLPPAPYFPGIDVEAVAPQQPLLLLVLTSAPQNLLYHRVGNDLVLLFAAGLVLALVDSPRGPRHYYCGHDLLR